MNAKITGWDTIGVTNIGVMDEGRRFNLQFTGTDGAVRNIFVPHEAVGPFVASLLAIQVPARDERIKSGIETGDVGGEISGQFLLGVSQIQIAADEQGTEYVLNIRTGDGLDLRFQLDPNSTVSLAVGLVAILAKHGISVALPTVPETKN